jgi:CheY-like chemotaxis protein
MSATLALAIANHRCIQLASISQLVRAMTFKRARTRLRAFAALGGRGSGAPPPRVLVLDDEPGIGRLVAAALEPYQAEVFTRPSEALRRAAEVAFDFIFCDYSMPEMTGADVYDALLRIQPGLARRFLLMTGSASTPELQVFLGRTGVGLLAKPFELRTLKGLVDAACSRRPLRRRLAPATRQATESG